MKHTTDPGRAAPGRIGYGIGAVPSRLAMPHSLIGLLLAGLICLLGGCVTPSAPSADSGRPDAKVATSSSNSPSNNTRLDRLLHELVTAVHDADSAAIDRLVSDRDPGFSSRARMIMDNLMIIKPRTFALSATGRTRSLSAGRARLLGDNAYAAEVKISWSVPGDRAPSDQTVWLTVLPTSDGSALAWAGTTDGPDGDRPTPLWWLEPIQYVHDQHAAVIAGSSADLSGWLQRADRAVADVSRRLTGGSQSDPAADWNKRLVVIVPSNESLLEQMLGVADGSESALAAITWPDGSNTSSAPNRVMINPAGIGTGIASDIVLTHEAVHVATGSPEASAPTWLIEGLADYVAYQAYPQEQESAAAALLTKVEKSGPPSGFPDESAFRTSGDDLELAYAEAWLACYDIARRYGADRLFAFYAAVDRSRTGDVNPAARITLGVGQDQLVADWRQFLRQSGARGSIRP